MRFLRDLEEHHFWMFWLYVSIACVLILIVGSAGIVSWLHTKGKVKFASTPTFDTSVRPVIKINRCSNGSVTWPPREDGCHAEDAPVAYSNTGEFSKALFAVRGPKGLTYHPVTIADMIATDPANWTGGMRPINKIAAVALAAQVMHTHITVEGWLTYYAHEADGDIHLRLCDAATVQGMDRKHCIVAEIIPELDAGHANNHLVLGQKLRVSGNYRYDAEGGCKQAKPSHCWHEVHPVRVLEIVQ